MTRYLSSSMQAASEAPLVKFRVLAEIEVRSQTLYACTGYHFITVGAQTYSPIGHLGGVEPIREEADVFPRAVRMWMSAAGSTSLAEPLSEALFNKQVRLYRTFVDPTSNTIVSTPERIFQGRINTGEIRMGDPERGNFYEIEVESRLRKQPAAAYFTRETLWTVLNQSGDTFLDYLHEISRRKAKWGTAEIVGYRATRRNIPGGPIYGATPIDLQPRGG